MGDLAIILYDCGQLDEAEKVEREVLDLVFDFGRRHPSTIKAMCNLAIILREQGKIEEAAMIEQEMRASQST
ncbi:hypothetical protein PIIN_10217 [Serendipita indica DSM 11827]|uniref:Kinesin light chain n=1 Tax=Serendipita indica (strain DSM 11827) TaxID=1109443 RepID=G4TY31_SERID|nr:hypothetical protein PIIN_10217 [Serendipita indica DSM 11827]